MKTLQVTAARRSVLLCVGLATVWCEDPTAECATQLPHQISKVLVVGANGKIGQQTVRLLYNHPWYQPLAMIRDVRQQPLFDNMGVATVLADLEYPVDHAFGGVDAVIFTAGSGDDSKSGRDKTVLVDHIGAIRAVVAAQMNNVSRFIMVSATNVDVRSNSTIAHYHRAKAHADNYLRDSATFGPALAWTIICPSRLHDESDDEHIEVGLEIKVSRDDPTIVQRGGVLRPEARTARANVAATLVAALPLANLHGKTLRLLDGNLSVQDALRKV